jgi:hypothetical protein
MCMTNIRALIWSILGRRSKAAMRMLCESERYVSFVGACCTSLLSCYGHQSLPTLNLDRVSLTFSVTLSGYFMINLKASDNGGINKIISDAMLYIFRFAFNRTPSDRRWFAGEGITDWVLLIRFNLGYSYVPRIVRHITSP